MNDISTEDRGHSALGGSTAHIWTNCHGYYHLVRQVGPKPVTEAMKDGTRLHDIAERALRNYLEYKKTGIKVKEASLPTADQAQVSEYISSVYEHALEGTITGKAWGFEDKFTISTAYDMYGYADFWGIYRDDKALRTGVVVDLKTGRYEVPVEDNAQLAFYAVGMRSWVRQHGKELDQIRTAVVQPHSYEGYKEPVTKSGKPVPLSAKQLDAWEKKFLKAGEAIIDKGSAKFKTGEWCQSCRYSGDCPTYTKEIVQKVGLPIVQERVNIPAVEMLTEEQLTNLYHNKDAIQDYLEKVEQVAVNRALAGSPLAGTKLVEKRTQRRWHSDINYVEEELKKLGVSDPVVYVPKVKGLVEIESQVGKNKLDHITFKPPGEAVLASEDDKRPAYRTAINVLNGE